jgi:hypothetical protein
MIGKTVKQENAEYGAQEMLRFYGWSRAVLRFKEV